MKTWKKRKQFQDECCNRKHIFNCKQGMGVNSKLFQIPIVNRGWKSVRNHYSNSNSKLISGSRVFNQENITINGIPFTYKRNVSPHAYVFVTENDEEALIYYKIKVRGRGRLRGSFELKDGRSFAFHECLTQCQLDRQYNYIGIYKYRFKDCLNNGYIFYQFNQTYLRSKACDLMHSQFHIEGSLYLLYLEIIVGTLNCKQNNCKLRVLLFQRYTLSC